MWADLPQPLVVHSTGWTPPAGRAHPDRPAMNADEINAYVHAVMVEFMPVLRAAVATWERLDIGAPQPEELVDMLIERALGPTYAADDDGP